MRLRITKRPVEPEPAVTFNDWDDLAYEDNEHRATHEQIAIGGRCSRCDARRAVNPDDGAGSS